MRFNELSLAWDSATAGGNINAAPGNDKRDFSGGPMAFKVALGPESGKGGGAARPPMPSRSAERHEQARSSSSLVTAALLILAASAAMFYASMRHDGQQPLPEPVAAAHAATLPHVHKTDPVAAARFARPSPGACDGRMRCNQMNSCAEAKYFLDNCPGASAGMDGDANGVPCEAQWCTAGAAAKADPL